MINSKKGFTLIELLVVISIIALLSSIILASVSGARAKARDAKRQLDLRQVKNALELYYLSAGAYPITTNTASFSTWNATTWAIAVGDPSQNLYSALVPNYISALPADPINRETLPGNFLGDNAPNDLGYYYQCLDGKNYILGTNLEKGGTTNSRGNYQLTN
jgi:type II secretion system protein G